MATKTECEKNVKKFCNMDNEEINNYNIKTTMTSTIKKTNKYLPFDDGDC